MARELPATDISTIKGTADLLRLVEEVQQSHQPRLLKRGDQQLAVVSPVDPRPKPRAKRSRGSRVDNDWILGLIGLGASEGPTDVSENKQKYLAEAYLAKLDPPDEK